MNTFGRYYNFKKGDSVLNYTAVGVLRITPQIEVSKASKKEVIVLSAYRKI